MFDFVSPSFRRIVRYKEDNIILHTVCDLTTLQELDPIEVAVNKTRLLHCVNYKEGKWLGNAQNC